MQVAKRLKIDYIVHSDVVVIAILYPYKKLHLECTRM